MIRLYPDANSGSSSSLVGENDAEHIAEEYMSKRDATKTGRRTRGKAGSSAAGLGAGVGDFSAVR